jgi:hypothetical protein
MRIISAAAVAVASVVVGVAAAVAGSAPAVAAVAPAAAQPGTAQLGTARSAALPAGDLGGVACQTAQNCLAVGVNDPYTPDSVARAASWNGKAWRAVTVKLTAGATTGQLDGVSCPGTSATDCVAVGTSAPQGNPSYYTSEFIDSWNGRSWAPLSLNNDAIFTLQSVSCLSRKDCLAVGTANSPDGGYSAEIAIHWNGATWTALAPPEPSTTTGFTSVSCAAGPFCVVIGTNDEVTARTLIDVWNGRTWKTLAPAKAKGVSDLVLNSVSCTSARSCVAVGNGTGSGTRGEVAEVWNGKSWTATAPIAWPRGATSPWVDGVSCATARYCLAVGYIDRNPQANGANTGRAAASVWNGKSWTATAVAAPGKGKASLFNGVTCLRTTFCAAVGQAGPYDGSNGTELAALWNGRSWHLVG